MAQLTLDQAFALARRHQEAGQFQQAEQIYRAILAQQPAHAGALHCLGIIAAMTSRNGLAVDLMRQSIAIKPDSVEVLNNLGIALAQGGRFEEAIIPYRQAIALRPTYAEAHNNLGVALWRTGQIDQAAAAYRQAILHAPGDAKAYTNLGDLLRSSGRWDEAIALCRQACVLNPALAEAHYNLGSALAVAGQLPQAIAAHRQALAVNPLSPEAHLNMGSALTKMGSQDEAIAFFEKAIALRPDYAEAHHNLAIMLLLKGDFTQGFAEYEWRLKTPGVLPRNFIQKSWDGSPLAGRTILLHAEQGFGDTIQFIRYVPMVTGLGGKVVVESQPPLCRLLAAICSVVAAGSPLPEFDVHCPLMSLPKIFGTTLASIPKSIPHLQPDTDEVAQWHSRLSGAGSSIKVGLAWAGRPTHANDRNRSIAPAKFAALAKIAGVQLFSLQKDLVRPPDVELIDMMDLATDFAGTAALIANLDLIVSVDTAVAHLAGAMGKPVWTLLPFAPDWRWMLNRQDTPWYPTMRLFRQQAIGDWDCVVQQVCEALTQLRGGL